MPPKPTDRELQDRRISRGLEVQGEIADQVEGLSRQPFRAALSRFMAATPEVEDLVEYAQRNPDRWAQSVAVLGRLAGYGDKTEVEHNVFVNISRMSDAEVELRIQKLLGEAGRVLDMGKVEVED